MNHTKEILESIIGDLKDQVSTLEKELAEAKGYNERLSITNKEIGLLRAINLIYGYLIKEI